MNSNRRNGGFGFIKKYFQFDMHEWTKLLLLSCSYFCIISSYSILRSLKSPIFLGLVGKDYQPYTRIISVILIIPCMLLYSKLIDHLKRYQVTSTILLLFGVLSIFFGIFLAHPIHGISNTATSPYRWVGWGFEFFMDLYSAVVVSAFWSYINSTSTPNFANRGYGFIVAISKLGGIIAPMAALCLTQYTSLSSGQSIPLLAFIAGLLLIASMFMTRRIHTAVPASYLQGYEAANEEDQGKTEVKGKIGVLEGLRLFITQPYVLGIFGLVYSIEIIAVIFDYQMQILMSYEKNNHIGEMSSYSFVYTASFQALGLLFALIGPSTLLQKIGIRACLMIMPISIIGLTLLLMASPHLSTIFFIMVVLRALNYGFNFPVREMLYIPTVKDIQFKSKAWVESFGKSISKGSGGSINLLLTSSSIYETLISNSMVSLGISAGYLVISFLMGRAYTNTMKHNKIIGGRRHSPKSS